MGHYAYEITARPATLGGGWRLRVHDDQGNEVAGGVFPIDADPDAGIRWWNTCSEHERAFWLSKAASARPADAFYAFLSAEEYTAAESQGQAWLYHHWQTHE